MPDPSLPLAADTLQTPDWSTLSEQIACPLCEYNLRGLTEPRCPECGYQFLWPDLLDPSRREHPYLFELKRKGRFKAFWKTAFHGLRPVKFWSALRADHRIVPRRLLLYWMIVSSFVLLAFAAPYFVKSLRDFLFFRSLFAPPGPSTWRFPVPRGVVFEWPHVALKDVLVIPAIVLAWPWVTYLSLSIFQISMRRAKVRQAHALRCVVYCSDLMLWLGVFYLLWSATVAVGSLLERPSLQSFVPYYDSFSLSYYHLQWYEGMVPAWFWPVIALMFTVRLMIAYRRYLRFQHVIATVAASQIITLLSVLAALGTLGLLGLVRW